MDAKAHLEDDRELMYGTMPSEKIPGFEMLPPVSVSTYPRALPPPCRDSAKAARSTPEIGDVGSHSGHDE